MLSTSSHLPLRSLALRVVALALVAAWTTGLGCYEFSNVSSAEPEVGADPSLLWTGNQLYSYTTSREGKKVPVHRGTTLTTWQEAEEAMGEPAIWVDTNKGFWAPDVIEKDGTYYLFYTAFVTSFLYGGNGKEHAIGVACASSPTGDFDDCGATEAVGPVVFDVPVYRDPACEDGSAATICQGVIDAEAVKHGSDVYLLWSLDWGPNGRAENTTRKIQGCRLNASLNACVGAIAEDIIVSDGKASWDLGTVENPTMVRGPEGDYVLYFSGGNYENDYATGVAYCGANPLDDCLKGGVSCIDDGSFPGVANPGGLDLVEFFPTTVIGVFHAGPDFRPGIDPDPRRMRTLTGGYREWVAGDPLPCPAQ